jgi:uncharacterized alkaline shock family protein YloU
MSSSLRSPSDKITVAPGVLLTVIRLAALQVAGVVRMGNTPGGVNRWLRRTPNESGVQIFIDEATRIVTIDVYIIADASSDLRQVSHDVQRQVAREIEDNIGMNVSAINIFIEDVEFSES